MCLVFFSYRNHPKYKMILCSNRDEFFHRQTQAAQLWQDSHIFAGRDLQEGGTWLGINMEGKYGFLTNYRDANMPKKEEYSRGHIITEFLSQNQNAQTYTNQLHQSRDKYTGFNVVLGDMQHLYYYNNIEPKMQKLQPGNYSLSNRFLNTPWPKCRKGSKIFHTILEKKLQQNQLIEQLFEMLTDSQKHEDFPKDTGLSENIEHILSSMFIYSDEMKYGTRSSTVVLIDYENRVVFCERTYKQNSHSDQIFEDILGSGRK